MSVPPWNCYLRCMNAVGPMKEIIQLPHNKPIAVGRNKECGIQDLAVSKKHIICVADLNVPNVIIEVVGQSYSGCNGYVLSSGQKYCLKHGDIIEMLLDDQPCYYVNIEMQDEPEAKKPKLELNITSPIKKLTISETKPKQATLDHFNITSSKSEETPTKKGIWKETNGRELLIYTCGDCSPRKKIAAFDVDGTIITTKSGNRFPKDLDDWMLFSNLIPIRLKELFEDDYKVVFFTNQAGLRNDSAKIDKFKSKMEKIVTKISLPLQIFVATGRTVYRKPAPGMWYILCEEYNGSIKVSPEDSFYVGDAAGRANNWARQKKKDHSLADRLFAMNIGLTFYTPEEFFDKSKRITYTPPAFSPQHLMDVYYPEIGDVKQEVIIMVGAPASGKSHYCRSELITRNYVHVSRDKIGSWQKCARVLEESLQQNKSVVVDNTNPSKAARQRYIDICKRFKVSCRCFVMNVTPTHAKHNNRFREITDKTHEIVSDMVFNIYNKAYETPHLSEGFTEIVKIPFKASFLNEYQEKLYRMYLLEN